MKFTKLVALFGSMLMISTYLPTEFVCAEDAEQQPEVSIWDGTFDTGWYDEEELEYHITTAAEYAGITSLSLNSQLTFEGKIIFLETDLDFGEESPGTIKEFKGVLDGSDHCIENINCGLIDVLYGEVRNISIKNAHFDHYTNFRGSLKIALNDPKSKITTTEVISSGNLGVICNTLYGAVSNCAIVNASIRQIYKPSTSYSLDTSVATRYFEHQVNNRWLMIRNDMNIGGICGEAQSGRIENCISDLTIEKTIDRYQEQVTAGQVYNNRRYQDIIVNETNTVFELPWHSVGGIAGMINNSIIVDCQTNKIKCYNQCSVAPYSSANQVPTSNPSKVIALARVGGICGECLNSSILRCSVRNESEEITSSDHCWRLTGGIVADAEHSILSCNVYSGRLVTSFKNLTVGTQTTDYRPQYDTTRTGGICVCPCHIA